MSDTTFELMSLATQQLAKLQKQAAFAKRAFVPAGGGAPPPGDPAAMGGMPPPGMDPAAMGGAPPPGMDPAMAGGMPPPGMDPAAMGGAPPPTTGDPNAAMMAGDPSGGMAPPGLPPDIMQQIVSAVTAQMGATGGGAGGAPGANGKPAKFDPVILDQKMDRLLLAVTELMKTSGKTLPPEALLAGTKHAPQGDPAAGGGAPGGTGGSAEPKLAAEELAATLRRLRSR